MDSPVELPDGRLVCGTHGHVVCPFCCVDYSFMEETLGEAEIDEDDPQTDVDSDDESLPDLIPLDVPKEDQSSEAVHDGGVPIGTGRVEFIKFNAQKTDSPLQLFRPRGDRFIRQSNPREALVFTDGACLDNGTAHARAGFAFVFGPTFPGQTGYANFRLENKGPTGEMYQHTSNRAELRAVLAALRYRYWPGEGLTSLVIATDSEYVVEGATRWVKNWLRNGWKTSTGTAVKNRDFWEALLKQAEEFADVGMSVKLWRIPRGQNEEADGWAKKAANVEEAPDRFYDICGVRDLGPNNVIKPQSVVIPGPISV